MSIVSRPALLISFTTCKTRIILLVHPFLQKRLKIYPNIIQEFFLLHLPNYIYCR